jgi:cbb3-type cytochrome oxidase cytochrome c subunit
MRAPICAPRPIPTPTARGLLERYPKARDRRLRRQPGAADRMDALIAYLQMLGTLVDFTPTTTKPICGEERAMADT